MDPQPNWFRACVSGRSCAHSAHVEAMADLRGRNMRSLSATALAVLLMGVGSAALAFQEQGGASAPPPATNTAPAEAAESKGVALTPTEVMPKGGSGTKIRIPGLGVIGEIPKMDFGLELLYGASEPKALEQDPNEASGVMLRGTIPLSKPGR